MTTLKEHVRWAKWGLGASLAGQFVTMATWHHPWVPAGFAALAGAGMAFLALSLGDQEG